MIFCFAKAHGGMPSMEKIELAVKRNFSGLEDFDAWEFFSTKFVRYVYIAVLKNNLLPVVYQ